ncbi:MAG: hypothetical protein ABI383_04385, partial [Acidobacteriaceae bacterium]
EVYSLRRKQQYFERRNKMENKIKSVIRVVIAGVVVLTGVAGLNSMKAQAASPSGVRSATVLGATPPVPICDPGHGCQLPW